jgi:hypothetical protein
VCLLTLGIFLIVLKQPHKTQVFHNHFSSIFIFKEMGELRGLGLERREMYELFNFGTKR